MAFTTPANNYVIGRGKIYFNQFATDTFVGSGERYIGNTPTLDMTSAYTNLDHYSSDDGIRQKDDSVQLQVDRNGSFSCDNISMDNLAMMFGSAASIVTQAGVTGESQLLTVKKGYYYPLGADSTVPDGVGAVANFQVTNNAGVRASGTVTFGGQPSAADTATINGAVITFVAGAPAVHQVQIGATATVTAQAFAQEINNYPHIYHVTASGASTAITLAAIATGTGGNAITLAKSGTNPTLSGATLASGTASGIIVQSGNYEIDLALGRLHILDNAASIADSAVIEVQYDVVVGTRSLVVDNQSQVEGALRFIADNPKGKDKDYFWPRVRLSPNGNYSLKGEAWQSMAFNFEAVRLGTQNLVYVRER